MLSKCSLPLSNWKSYFTNCSTPISTLNLHKSDIVQTMITVNRSGNCKDFQRFFTKKSAPIEKTSAKPVYFDPETAKEYEARCEQGDVQAIVLYGDSLLGGLNGAKMDKEKAVRYFKIGADKNDLQCMFHYAFCLYRGDGVQRNVEKAISIFKEAARRGHAQSMYFLFQCYLDGVKLDKLEVLRYLKDSADQNYIYSLIAYGMQLPLGDPQRIEYLKRAADQGSQIGEFIYGYDLLISNKDTQKGLFYIKKSADSGFHLAQIQYGKLLYEGNVVKKDLKAASHYFNLSLKSGSPDVYYEYANFLIKKGNKSETELKEIKEYMKKAADMGNVNAMANYAIMISNGIIKSEKGSVEAIPYLKKAIEKGSTAAMIFYAKLAEKGQGFSQKEPKIAEKYYLMAAEADKTNSTYQHCIDFYCDQKDYAKMEKFMKLAAETGEEKPLFDYGSFLLFAGETEKAKIYLRQSSEKGNPYAMNLYSTCIIKDNPDEAYKLLKKAIDQRCAPAMFNYATFLSEGKFPSLKIDKSEAFHYMKMAADNGIDGAVLKLADWLFMGINCKKNVTEAMKYFKISADKTREPNSLFIYGYTNLRGFGGYKVDQKIGFKYIKMAADQNFPPAIKQLGNIYNEGIGVKKNEKLAADYYKKAADLGEVSAIEPYVKCLLAGNGVEKNVKEAINYLKMGADKGDAYCNYNMGICYMRGFGVERNHEKGMEYLRIAKEKGIEHAMEIGEHYFKKDQKNPF